MSDKPTIAIIGAGIFGCKIALSLAEKGYEVVLFERQSQIMMGCSSNNQHRLHLGAHYPRDLETAKLCQKGFKQFIEEFGECVVNNFPNYYFIASQNSLTSPAEYIKFCDKANLEYKIIDAKNHTEVRNCDLGILCKEVIYDAEILKSILINKIKQNKKIELCCNAEIETIKRTAGAYKLQTLHAAYYADVVINCSYSEINRLTQQLGKKVEAHQFEYVVVPIIELDIPQQGITIMDGNFMTLIPHGASTNFLLYHVQHSVIAKQIGITHDKSWNKKETSPFATLGHIEFFENLCAACIDFVPSLSRAKTVGFLETPRMVLANRDKDDSRPSIITDYDDNYYSVFAGKIDHCMWVAEELSEIIDKKVE